MKENKSNLISIISLGNDDPVKKTAELFIMMTKDFDEELLLPIVKSGVEVLQWFFELITYNLIII